MAVFDGKGALALQVLVALASLVPASAYAADMVTKAPVATSPSQSDLNSYVIWAGAGYKYKGVGSNIGGVYALNGDLGASGWLVRGQAAYGGYSYASGLAASGTANGTYGGGNVAAGYQIVGNVFSVSGFVGYDYQDNRTNTPDPNSPAAGVRSGAIFIGRIATEGDQGKYPVELNGSYSTAYNSYWTRGRAGVKVNKFVFGGEATGLGSDFFAEARFGGFVKYEVSKNFGVEMSGGYAYGYRGEGAPSSRGASGPYVEVGLVFIR